MAAVSRLGDACTEATFSAHTISSNSANVMVNSKGCATLNKTVTTHVSGGTTHLGTSAKISGGSATVLVNGLKIARVGDAVDCGSAISAGSPDVNAG